MADKSPPRQWPGADDDAEKGAPEMVETIPTPKKDGPVLPRDWPSWKKNVTVALVSALNFLVYVHLQLIPITHPLWQAIERYLERERKRSSPGEGISAQMGEMRAIT